MRKDPHDRVCQGACGQTYTPYSMGTDKNVVRGTGRYDPSGHQIRIVEPEDIIVPPGDYTCLSCRQLASA